jgi:hypothetical protein
MDVSLCWRRLLPLMWSVIPRTDHLSCVEQAQTAAAAAERTQTMSTTCAPTLLHNDLDHGREIWQQLSQRVLYRIRIITAPSNRQSTCTSLLVGRILTRPLRSSTL